ncbi:MAG: polysaccharide biosynthesis C-terminal domain-containing protein [Bacteroidales bacterium]|nr:polysaccharide biosynthesis C-terminal domain-containing protein [Bacteroidales bacterium]
MQQRFLRNIAFLLTLNLLIKPFWILGVDRSVQNAVGESAYGLYLSVYSFSFLFYILLDLGITNYNSRTIAQNNSLVKSYFTGIATVKFFLALVYAIITFGVAALIGYKGAQLYLLGWVAVNQILLSMILYLRSNIAALFYFKTDSFLSVLDRLIMIGICSILLWGGRVESVFRIEWFVYAQTAAYILTFVVALLFLMLKAGRLHLGIPLPLIGSIVRSSLPYALLVLLMSFYNRLEPVLIERLLPEGEGLVQTGIYGKAFRLLDAGNNISLLFSVLLLPMFASMLQRREPVSQLVRQSFSLIVVMSSTVAALALAYSEELMQLLYGQSVVQDPQLTLNPVVDESVLILRILMGSFVSVSITYVFGTLLTANGNLKQLNLVAASGVVVNLLMNYLLIPEFKAVGAAWASFGVQAFTALIQMALAFRLLGLRFGTLYWWRLLEYLLLLALAVGASTILPLSWPVAFGIGAISALSVAFISRMIDIADFRQLVADAGQMVKKKA